MTRSAEEVEREVEATRSSLDRTVEALKEKMTPTQILDDMKSGIEATGSRVLTEVGDQVRENPLPLALIGLGLAWLAFGNRGSSGSTYERRSFSDDRYVGGGAYGASGHGESLKDRTMAAAHSVGDKVTGAVSSAGDTARAGVDRIQTVAGSAMDAAASARRTAQRTWTDTLDRDPLIFGAVGLAVGAAIGAALPSTRIENRYAGPLRDKVVDRTKAAAQHGLEEVRDVTQAAYDGVKAELGKPSNEGESLADKAETVARAGVQAAQQELQGRPH